ncbi:MAG TPA: ISNCY family transposase [Candidatus Dormibacteraeota bacterium]|jgi:transposase|nr:ISNCY family transposase [Candidatus Dormibacteraeota bacterium]
MAYTRAAVERVMKVQEAILRALSGRQSWLQVADVLGVSPRTVRRLRWRYERYGYDGLFDHRRRRPSPRAVPLGEVQRLLRLYREHYGPRDGHPGFNIRHFYQVACRDHRVRLSYSFVKQALQTAGLVGKRRPRGRHRRRRAPRPCFGELVPLDGSLHPWLALVADARQTLIAVVDDATKQLLYAQLVAGGESLAAIMTALRAVLEQHGIPGALYTDRAGWAVYTPTSGTAPDRTKRTQVGRALARLGIEHIVSFSPQARGRSERANGTLQGRLVNELRVAGIQTLPAANRYLRERFIPDYNARFGRAPADPSSAFVPVGRQDLDQILCHEDERCVARDNTLTLDGVVLQIDKQRGRRSCAGLRVLVRRHLDGRHSVWWGPRCLGWFTATGRPWRERAA